MYEAILVAMALDHDLSRKTLALAQSLMAPGGRVLAIHVLEEPQGTANARLREDLDKQGIERAKALFTEKLSQFPGVEAKLVRGHVGRTILEFASSNAIDCIVMGSHKPGLVDYLIGSTASRVVRHAPCSVHVYRDI